ncbi:TPR and ankyrin repeat-containing protein 1 [Mytilus edulis]|uniref:TPR and ankyrin repeat-containing protein 1 n=1 Tax=Mytilus edulis TaxID=6550 RepID=A0A8S3RF73_MYTED|nr:TPR and ankyrin repeat-containing protein 1 [Mytilus edulis]
MEYDRSKIQTDVELKKLNDQQTVQIPSVQEEVKQRENTLECTTIKQPEKTQESYLSQIEKLISSISQKTAKWEQLSMEPSKETDVTRKNNRSEDIEESELDGVEFEFTQDTLERKPWEVECTSGVLKSLQSNRILPVFKRRIVKIIDSLASGIYSKVVQAVNDRRENKSRSFDEHTEELRQMFISKNGMLCREVQKNFKSFIDGDEKTSKVFKLRDEDFPNRLQDITEHEYPLFITAKHFWLMLDATLGPPYYFDRHIDGSLKSEIQGWTDIDDMQTILDDEFDSEYSDESESDEDEEELDEHITLHENKRTRTIKIDPRREVTYEVFEAIIWPRLIWKFKKHQRKYHPSLVWTEIMSIIKGSYEAISDGKYLNKIKYFEIGKKQAPAFVDDREILHMFDQTDLVRNLFQRFCKQNIPKWKVHEIYVDEAQDFAQAELFLLIKLCESPHGMFVTGDTAQSIMKGISFRFKDLVSLFRYASKDLPFKTVGVSVLPHRIYELPHNYRSHSGITALATSVLDILKDLFPDSFDSLPSDQCLFEGPNPVLLETVSSDQLSLILCNNKRETSKIEFGAHQVILVVNDKSRDNIPEEMKSGLVLTLYEAKGLEFDDVLLYNLFTDSEATKEWRVVLSFLENLSKNDSNKESRRALQISAGSRPLTFDPKQHKVLNSELKQLYTAITRARQNVWIFDEDKVKRRPMFEYFKALQLVDVVPEGDDVKSFICESTPREWIAEGEKYMQKKNISWLHNASILQVTQEKKTSHMHMNITEMPPSNLKIVQKKKDELYLATIKFLKARKTKEAARCLETAKHFDLAANVYEKKTTGK